MEKCLERSCRANRGNKTIGRKENAKLLVPFGPLWEGQRAILVTYLRRIRFRSCEMANRVLSHSRIYTMRFFRCDDTEIQSYFSLFSLTFIAPAIVLKADPRNGNDRRGLETNSESEKRLNRRYATITTAR